MFRRASANASLTLLTGALLLAGALPAEAFFAVEERGSTTTVTQNDTERLTIVNNPGGSLVLTDGVAIVGHAAAKNLVVRGPGTLTTTFVDIVLNEPLEGSLTLDLPGASDVTIAGASAVIGGSLKVKGSDVANQTVRLGDAAQSITIEGNVKLDLRDVEDWVEFRGPAKILGSLAAKGVNHLTATILEVGGSFVLDTKKESLGFRFISNQLFVGKSLLASSGPGFDYFSGSIRGAVGGNVTFKVGDGGCRLYAYFVTGGKLTARMGAGALNEFYPGFVKGSVDVQSFGARNDLELRNVIQGKSIKYTGGAGVDDLLLQSDAAQATATIDLGDGNDEVYLDGMKLARLRLDFGAGTDRLDLHDFVTPPGSTITGLP